MVVLVVLVMVVVVFSNPKLYIYIYLTSNIFWPYINLKKKFKLLLGIKHVSICNNMSHVVYAK